MRRYLHDLKCVPFTKCGIALCREFFIHSPSFGSLFLHCTNPFAGTKTKKKHVVNASKNEYLYANIFFTYN